MTKLKPNLDAAYALKTPEDNVRLYADWADSYDQDFAQKLDYQLPMLVARAFVLAGGKGPVLDIGAGTGLAAQALGGLGIGPIDGTDISNEMLGQARAKGIYRNLFWSDLTQSIPCAAGSYAGAISSGTFTTGHVGPDALDRVIGVCQTGGVVAISVNAGHFKAKGFDRAIDRLSSRISQLHISEHPIYGAACTDDHAADMCQIVTFSVN